MRSGEYLFGLGDLSDLAWDIEAAWYEAASWSDVVLLPIAVLLIWWPWRPQARQWDQDYQRNVREQYKWRTRSGGEGYHW